MSPGVSARQMSMAKLITGMTVSLDGFVADREGNSDALYPDLAALKDTPYMEAMAAETGAVLMGRGAFEMAEDADAYADSYEPTADLRWTHQPPDKHPKENDELTFTFVTDGLESAVAQAKSVAGARSVQCIGGADMIEQLMRAGLVDELHVDVMPVILGGGRRFLDGIDRSIELEKAAVVDQGQRTSIRVRIRRP